VRGVCVCGEGMICCLTVLSHIAHSLFLQPLMTYNVRKSEGKPLYVFNSFVIVRDRKVVVLDGE
jgi:hypothetical protein